MKISSSSFIGAIEDKDKIGSMYMGVQIVYVDEQFSNRAAMQINFEDMDIGKNLILKKDGHKVVSFFSTLINALRPRLKQSRVQSRVR
jgi:hypothetical protein